MALDPEFKKQTDELIRQTLDLYKTAGASPRVGAAWKCENVGDFLCGFVVGEVGAALGAFQSAHGREPTEDEHIEIIEMVEGHSPEIIGFFSRFNGGGPA